MGCINSARKTTNGEVFRIRVVRLQPEASSIGRNGFLELTKKELTFIPNRSRNRENDVIVCDVIVWQLQHLRRYGLSDDNNVFSFEAGRRCMSGPGIFTFRCPQNAERLYQLFQRYVNAVSLVANEESFGVRYEHPSITLGRPETSPHSNNYLEPAPISNIPTAAVHRMQVLQENFSSSPLSLLDSPDSVPSLSFTNEMIQLSNNNNNNNNNSNGTNSIQHHHPSTPISASYANVLNSNLYSEHPFRSSSSSSNQIQQKFFGSSSTNSTLQRRPLFKHEASLDAPQECAPLPPITPTETLHNYANVETGLGKLHLITNARSIEMLLDSSERCYENLNRMDLPLLLQPPPTRQDNCSNPKEKDQSQQQEQHSTTCCGVNYIVLDLDQPRSPTQNSTCFGSGLSIVQTDSTSLDVQSPSLTAGLSSSIKENNDDSQHHQQQQQQQQQQQKNESSLGYSTIDFIKTCALIKSTASESDFEFDAEHDAEESRITRHSKCVRKAYSISE